MTSSAPKESENSTILWTRFLESKTQDDYFNAWLELQVHILPATVQALVVASDDLQTYAPVCSWPADAADPERLAEIAERCLAEKCGLVSRLETDDGQGRFGIAFPFFMDEQLMGVVAMEVDSTVVSLKITMEQLQWGVSWLELSCRRLQMGADKHKQVRLKAALDLLALVLSEDHFEPAAMALATELATVLNCDRVSIGFLKKGQVEVQAVSHSADFGEKMNLVRTIGAAMDEAVLMRQEIVLPLEVVPDVTPPITHHHEKLALLHGNANILTLPFYGRDRYLGAITLERPGTDQFTQDDLEFCRGIAALAFPAIEEKRINDRSLFGKAKDDAGEKLKELFGTGHYGWKLAVIGLVCLVLFFSVATGQYRLTADSMLEGEVRRVVAAPFSSYIGSAEARAGDQVEEGQVLCTLDDRDLRQERLGLLSQRNQYQRQHQEARATHDRAETKILAARLEQIEAKLQLVEDKLVRTVLTAPFAGLLVSGDLSMRLGGFVEQGEVLFEVTPLNQYRLILKVDERRIADVVLGQSGSLLLTALPRTPFHFIITKITPIARQEEGRNYFEVEANLMDSSDLLRPGMEGIAKVEIGKRKLFALWSRNLVEWCRLFFWKWLP
jgi:multidrug resistance efflux pump